MIAVLSKPADQVGVSDLKELIDSEVPESDQIEFKERLSTKGDSDDRWITHGDRLGDRARESILEEAVAFANAYGGALLLGIVESGSRPPIAAAISPIPRCADLAERLKLVFRDCVEPQMPIVEIFAVPTDGESGVVVIRTGRSRMAPHRVTTTLDCPIRRSDRCEKMTMREIHDLTLNLSRGLERLERRLETRSKRFVDEFERITSPDRAHGIRVTAAPLGEEVRFERVYDVSELYEPWHRVLLVNKKQARVLQFPTLGNVWQPMLRAARNDSLLSRQTPEINIYRETHSDGLVEIGIVDCHTVGHGIQNQLRLFPERLIVVFANAIVWANGVRNYASVPSSEFAIEVELYVRGENISVRVDDLNHIQAGRLRDGGIKYPRYSLGETDEIPRLISLFERDFWDSIGSRFGGYEGDYVIED